MNCLDSDLLIGFLRGDRIAKDCIERAKGNVATTVINVFELLYQTGSLSEDKRAAVEGFVSSMNVLPLDMESAAKAADVGHGLAKEGRMIDTMDLFIGAISMTNSCTLYTRNDKHFSRIAGLAVKKW